jgi:hypothetical protein
MISLLVFVRSGCMQVDAQIFGFSFVMMIVHVFADTTDI